MNANRLSALVFIAVCATAAGCSHASQAAHKRGTESETKADADGAQQVEDGSHGLTTTNRDPDPVPVELEGPCAEFNRSQKNALSAEAHQRQFGCPPCPCACTNGEITCAPCAACESFGSPENELRALPEPN